MNGTARTMRYVRGMSIPARPRSRWIGGLAVIASLSLTGCLGLSSKPPKQLVSLSPTTSAQAGAATTGTLADAILVHDPEADRSLDVLRVPVRINASTIAYMQDIAWVEKPSRQFRSLLSETLRARTGRLVVEDGDFEAVGRTMITGRLLAMGYDAPSQSVIMRIDMHRQDKGGAIVSRRFEASVPGIQPKAAPVAAALGQVANDVAGQVAVWITG